MLSACHQIAGWSPQRTQGQSPLMGYGYSTVSTARPALGVEFSVATLMLMPSLSLGLLCSWVTGQRQKWLSRMLTDIHSTGHLSHLIIKVPLSLFLTNSPGTQISSCPVSKDLYPHTSYKTLLSWILELCPWPFHPTMEWPHFMNW